MKLMRTALTALALLTLLTGAIYPLAITALAQLLMPRQANGSLVFHSGQAVGSALLGQQFHDDRYFWGRLSATHPTPYRADASGGSNRGPLSSELQTAAADRVEALRAADPLAPRGIPIDLVTASGSGLDPHISPAAAYYQAGRVARLRGLPVERVRALIGRNVQGRFLGVLGEPRVNVLLLNLALDEQAAGRQSQ
jgi:potassium-transporting ATPase KdpC subunit